MNEEIKIGAKKIQIIKMWQFKLDVSNIERDKN